ncbi:super-infection exclusion protein B [Arcobacter cryaerophilus gv. pseudocryaerophilus]|uniref:Super-infection exclusion protein B n=3 Tax=Arcobacteraceae TaxID=2808963 RepID=A0AA96IJE0_9BACT|nr:super-infection exclusion protein B [Arcobacter sp. AZ-2023]WNL36333.1 super-infection exclusion protein B [Arcobacter sp. AZ-2023]WPD12049.1 super-infection exclusion protein B [Arcobacter sp. DSM 115960]
MDWPKTLLEFIKLTPKNITPFLLISAILLFAPREWLIFLNILDLKEEYHFIISMIFLLSSIILINYILFFIFSFFKKSLIRIKIKSRIKKRLHNLTEDEKQILRFYISQNTRANTLVMMME